LISCLWPVRPRLFTDKKNIYKLERKTKTKKAHSCFFFLRTLFSEAVTEARGYKKNVSISRRGRKKQQYT
jgi:hypothetical protein